MKSSKFRKELMDYVGLRFDIVIIVVLIFFVLINNFSVNHTFIQTNFVNEHHLEYRLDFLVELEDEHPEYFEEVLLIELREDTCKRGDHSFFQGNYVFGVICILDWHLDEPFIFKSTVYHELGHAVWYFGLTNAERKEYELIYVENTKLGILTSNYSEENVKEGFAEDFMVYHMKDLHWVNSQASNTINFLENILT